MTNDTINLGEFSDDALAMLRDGFCLPEDELETDLRKCVVAEISRRANGYPGQAVTFTVPLFDDENLIHSTCHKLLLLGHGAEKCGHVEMHSFFMQFYRGLVIQLGFEPVDTAFVDEQRVVH